MAERGREGGKEGGMKKREGRREGNTQIQNTEGEREREHLNMQKHRRELSKCFLKQTLFPSLDKYSDLKVALFNQRVSNHRALTVAIKRENCLEGFVSLYF